MEIVEENKTGLLVERGSADELADAILRLLSDDSIRKSMGKAGRQRAVELFSWDRIVEKLLEQYKCIANGHTT
jgi:glycosyltransferase involved in cell wall biosynthesis